MLGMILVGCHGIGLECHGMGIGLDGMVYDGWELDWMDRMDGWCWGGVGDDVLWDV